jgi:hypothetical protein
MNTGFSSRQQYDTGAYKDKLNESTGPLLYRLSTDQMYNENSCLSTFGPRASQFGRGYDVSRTSDTGFAPSQDLIDIDSILSNRNVKESKLKSGHYNPINPTKFKTRNSQICNNFNDTENSRLSYPAQNYREVPINRFYNLPKDPQATIFWNFAANSRLEATDNYKPQFSQPWADSVQPKESK